MKERKRGVQDSVKFFDLFSFSQSTRRLSPTALNSITTSLPVCNNLSTCNAPAIITCATSDDRSIDGRDDDTSSRRFTLHSRGRAPTIIEQVIASSLVKLACKSHRISRPYRGIILGSIGGKRRETVRWKWISFLFPGWDTPSSTRYARNGGAI